MAADTRPLRPQDRDPWYGYDHWRLGRVQVARRAHRLLAARPVLVPVVGLLSGIALVAGGLGVDAALADDSSANWVPAALLGLGAVALLLGMGGLISSLALRLTAGWAAGEDRSATGTQDTEREEAEP